MSRRAAHKKHLRELTISRLKPKSAAYLVWDAYQHHLAIRVEPTGRKSWKVIYSRQGRARWLTLGDTADIPLADARSMAAQAMLAVAQGKDPAAEKRAERGAGTWADLAARYVEHAKGVNKSWRQGARLVERYVTPRWGKLQASSITRADVKALLARIEGAPVLQNQVLASVSAVFSWAAREDILPANPAKGIQRNKTTSRERVLSDSELPLFWAEFDSIGVVGTALKVLLLLGQRPGEIAHMRHEHLVDGWWQMPGELVPELGWPGTKNGQSHRVWLPAPAKKIIDELSNGKPSGFVFGSRSGLDKAMRDICKKLGVDSVRPHDLRRTHGSAITALGFGRDAMNRVQNHREGGIADVYDRHRYESETKRIMETVAAKIMGVVEGKEESGKVVQMPVRRG